MYTIFPGLPDPGSFSLPWIGSPWALMTASPLRQLLSVAVLMVTLWLLHRLKLRAKVGRTQRLRDAAQQELREVDANLQGALGASDDLGISQCSKCYAIVGSGDLTCSQCGAPLPGGLFSSLSPVPSAA